MKVRTFMTLLVILGVVIGLSGTAIGQIDTIGSYLGTNAAGDSASHTINLNLTFSGSSTVDTVIILFPVGTKLNTDNVPDTSHLVMVDGIKLTNALDSYEALNGHGGNRFTYLRGRPWRETDTLNAPLVYFELPAAGQSASTTHTLKLSYCVASNDTSIGTSPRIAGAYRDTIVVFVSNAVAAGGDTVVSRLYSPITAGAASQVTLEEDFDASKTDTCGMTIGWSTNSSTLEDTLTFKVKDEFGNVVFDSTGYIKLEAYNNTYTLSNPGGGKLLRLKSGYNAMGGFDAMNQYDTLMSSLNSTISGGGDGIGTAHFIGATISYSKAASIKFRGTYTGNTNIYYGTSSNGTNTRQFVRHRPKLLSLNPSTQTSNVEVNSSTSVFTVAVSDSFGNVCYNDSVVVSTYRGEAQLYNGTSASSVTNNVGNGPAGVYLDIAGKSYWKGIVGTVASTDSLIFQTYEIHTLGHAIARTDINLRKAIPITIIAGEVSDISIYPSNDDLTDQDNTMDYYEGNYGETGRVRAGYSVTFVAKITDQFGNEKDVSSSYASDSIIWTYEADTTTDAQFTKEGVDTTNSKFSVDVDTVVFTTSTTIDTYTVTATAKLPSGSERTASTTFYTKGGVPEIFKWKVSSGEILTTATDTVRVDSVLSINTFLWDAYYNPADTHARVTYGVGYKSVVGSGNADNDGIGRNNSHILNGLTSMDTMIHNWNNNIPPVNDTTYSNVFFNSDSTKGYTYIYISVGGTKKDSIKIIKHPENTYSLDLKLVQDDGTEVDNDSSAGAIVAGSKKSFYVRLYDRHNNLIVPDTVEARDSTIHTGSLFIGYNQWIKPTSLPSAVISVDTLIKDNPKGGDSSKVAFIGTTAGDWGVVYSGSYSVLNSEGYVKYTLRTQGGRSDLGKIYVQFVGDRVEGTTPSDTAFFRTTLPEALSYFAVFVSTPPAFNAGTETSYDVGTNYTINLSPKDVGGNPIYAIGVTKLELHLLDSDGNALTFDTTKTAPTAPIQAVYWSSNSGLNMMDSVSGIVWTGVWSASDSQLSSGDSSLTINVKSTKVLTGAKLRVIANTEEITTEYDSTYDLSLSWDAGAVDTIEVAPVSATTNHSNVSGLDNNFVVKEYQTARVTLNKLDSPTGMQFFATIIDNPLNGHTFNPGIYGYSSMYTVSTATLNAPSSLNATDVSGDAGGYVKLSWTASANHPGMTGTTDDDLPITYYQIYRSTTNNIASASNWAYIPATPLTSSSNTTVAAEVSTNGQTGAAYYWVAACNGDLPIATTSSASATASKVYYNKDSKAATISANYAVMGANGALISAVSNSNMATATSDAQAALGDYNGNNEVDLSDMSLLLSVYGVSEEYDPVFDFNSNSDVDLSDLSTILANYGKTVGKASVAPKMGTSKINTKVNSNGDVFDLSVDFEGEESINAYGFVVSYNPAHYEFVDATRGALLSDGFFLTNDSKPGRLVVINMMRDGSEMAQGNAANLRFQWIGEEVSSLTIENISTMNDGSEIFGVESKVIESPVAIPKEFALKQNYPNPFNPTTTIKFEMPKSSNVKLEIYNILGQKVKTLVNEDMKAGYHKITWDGTNDYSVKVSSGMYIYIIKAGDFIARHKMVLLK